MRTKQARELGSKFFGRAVRALRLSLDLSQEDLAARANVSVTSLGIIEREQGRLSEQVLCDVCLALESEAGRPMLKAVFDGAVGALWQELRSLETRSRKDLGWEPAVYPDDLRGGSAVAAFSLSLECYLDAQRELFSAMYRFWEASSRTTEAPLPKVKKQRGRCRTSASRQNGA